MSEEPEGGSENVNHTRYMAGYLSAVLSCKEIVKQQRLMATTTHEQKLFDIMLNEMDLMEKNASVHAEDVFRETPWKKPEMEMNS